MFTYVCLSAPLLGGYLIDRGRGEEGDTIVPNLPALCSIGVRIIRPGGGGEAQC
jgi:hypothetical protein